MRRRPALGAVVAATLLASSVGAVAAPASGVSSGCPNPGRRTPIVFVHGLNGSAADFSAVNRPPGATDLIQRLSGPDRFANSFDYSSVADRWVTDPGIGPALAARISCLAAASRAAGGLGKVIVVAHSMGGLAARQAASLTDPATGRSVGDDIGLLITVATPNSGSWSDGLFRRPTNGAEAAAAAILQGACAALGKAGGSSAQGGRPGICGDAQTATSQAGRAMVPGSAQLAALPDPPAGLPVDAVAGKLTVTAQLFLVRTTFTVASGDVLGDLLVRADSALRYGTRAGADSYTDSCSYAVHELWDQGSGGVLGWRGCEHGGLLYDPGVGQQIASWVNNWLATETGPLPNPCPAGAGVRCVKTITVDVDGDGQPDVIGYYLDNCNPTLLTCDAHIRVNTRSGASSTVDLGLGADYAPGILGAADLDGRPGAEIVYLNDQGAHSQLGGILTWRSGSLRRVLGPDGQPFILNVDGSYTSNAGAACRVDSAGNHYLDVSGFNGSGFNYAQDTNGEYTGSTSHLRFDADGNLVTAAPDTALYFPGSLNGPPPQAQALDGFHCAGFG